MVSSNEAKGRVGDGTVRIKLQAERGWVLTGRRRGRNVNTVCFAFLKEPFPHCSRSRLALSGMGTQEKVCSVGATGAVCSQAPGIHPHATDNPVGRWGARTHHRDPHEVQGPARIQPLLRARLGSKLLPTPTSCLVLQPPSPIEELGQDTDPLAHPLAQSGACPWALSTSVHCNKGLLMLQKAYGKGEQEDARRWDWTGSEWDQASAIRRWWDLHSQGLTMLNLPKCKSCCSCVLFE